MGWGRKVKTLLSLLSWYNFNLLVLRSYLSQAACKSLFDVTPFMLCDGRLLLASSNLQQALWRYALTFSQAPESVMVRSFFPSKLQHVLWCYWAQYSHFSGVSVVPWWCGGVSLVSWWWLDGISVVARWCLGGAGGLLVVSRWRLAGVMLAFAVVSWLCF